MASIVHHHADATALSNQLVDCNIDRGLGLHIEFERAQVDVLIGRRSLQLGGVLDVTPSDIARGGVDGVAARASASAVRRPKLLEEPVTRMIFLLM
ncbi:hypothetical protein ACO2I3_17300 [Leptospira interrogans]